MLILGLEGCQSTTSWISDLNVKWYLACKNNAWQNHDVTSLISCFNNSAILRRLTCFTKKMNTRFSKWKKTKEEKSSDRFVLYYVQLFIDFLHTFVYFRSFMSIRDTDTRFKKVVNTKLAKSVKHIKYMHNILDGFGTLHLTRDLTNCFIYSIKLWRRFLDSPMPTFLSICIIYMHRM